MLPVAAWAETLRIATLACGSEPRRVRASAARHPAGQGSADIAAILDGIARLDADILLLSDVDYDLDLQALGALRDRAAEDGCGLSLSLCPPAQFRHADGPRSGRQTGGSVARAMRRALAISTATAAWRSCPACRSTLRECTDLSDLLWRDLPGTPHGCGRSRGGTVQRLSSSAHWDVPVILRDGQPLHLLVFHATPPVFDGPEDRNGRRESRRIGSCGDTTSTGHCRSRRRRSASCCWAMRTSTPCDGDGLHAGDPGPAEAHDRPPAGPGIRH